MTWTLETSRGFEAQKIWPLAVPYCNGTGLDIGCGPMKCLPHMIGVDKNRECQPDVCTEADEIGVFADESLDFIFSSHLLEHVPKEDVPDLLWHWTVKLKEGGHLVLYLPSAARYPRVGEAGANPDHKWDIYPGDVWEILTKIPMLGSFERLVSEDRAEGDEYSLFEVYRKIDGPNSKDSIAAQPPPKRVLVIRYGAIGDVLIASSVVQKLHEDGYDITFFTNPVGEEILRHDPRISEILVHDITEFPAGGALEFYEAWERRFDKVVNLDHSLEGPLLGHRKYLSHRWPVEARRLAMGAVNYADLAHTIAGDPGSREGPRFFASEMEVATARTARDILKRDLPGPIVLWAITGSSLFKVYPWINVVVDWLMDAGTSVVLCGHGEAAAGLQQGIGQALHEDREKRDAGMERIFPRVNQWSIRETLTFARYAADVVVGPETGVLNAVSHAEVAKVIYLSHSSIRNLTANWRHTASLLPDTERCPCYPCHMIHYDWSTCHRDETTEAALCASSIAPEMVYEAIKQMLVRYDHGGVPPPSFIGGQRHSENLEVSGYGLSVPHVEQKEASGHE